ncbi:2-hydroxyacid dehydrogenase [Halalkalibacterium ligniniphilum]|uniref:2-hydroxyacid dehydrogenase n=1 Tax=Halalkalibacterium ligniniphilum TaxID=1134413 RepID=UPI00034DB4D8|nr:D-glycerate dehydrogenase [Halalkalibacterium ligniniphilum]
MKQKVIVYKKMPKEVLDLIQKHCEIVYFENIDENTYPSFLTELKDADAIFGSGLRVDKELLEQAPQLKVVSNASVGYDNLDIIELTKRKIMATNTPEVLNDTTADTIFGLLLATARRMPELDRYVKSGQWDRTIGEDLFGVDVHHKTLGIIGMGKIGAAIAKRAHLGFDMNILYHNRSRNAQAEASYHAKYSDLEELLQTSDFVCLMTPLTPETEKLMGEKEFKLMKKEAIFINGSRGKTVDEAALIRALQNGEILAAGLDVFVQEPIQPDHPFLTMKNVVTLPHIGSATAETRLKMALLGAKNIIAGMQGNRPPCLLNKEVWEIK